MEIIVDSFNKEYKTLTKHVREHGKEISPRGQSTLEIRPVLFTFQNPKQRLVSIYERNINPFFLVVEALWILAGREDVATLSNYNSNIVNFSDDGFYFHAAYGKRLRSFGSSIEIKTKVESTTYTINPETELQVIDKLHSLESEIQIDQLKEIYNLFMRDENSRQAVASIWNPVQDLNNSKTKDISCNNILYFKIRDNQLHLTVSNRSNDIHWGLPTNLYQFSMILEVMSFVLQKEVGHYNHLTDSLHLYLDLNYDITERLLNIDGLGFDIYDFIVPGNFCLNEKYKTIGKENLFDKTFSAIENSMLAIETFEQSFDNFIIDLQSNFFDFDAVTDNNFSFEDLENFFKENIEDSYFMNTVKSQSFYLYNLVKFALSYFLFKKSFNFYKEKKNIFLFEFLFSKVFYFLNQEYIDYRIVGTFYLDNLLKKRLEDNKIDLTQKKIIIKVLKKQEDNWKNNHPVFYDKISNYLMKLS